MNAANWVAINVSSKISFQDVCIRLIEVFERSWEGKLR